MGASPHVLLLKDVAMVIITTMVAKIYFPESLERGVAIPEARAFNYRMADGTDDYYGSELGDDDSDVDQKSDDDDDDDDDENEVLASDEDGEEQQPSADDSDDLLNEMRPPHTCTPVKSGVSYGNTRVLEFEQLTMSKTQVLMRLALCIVMLNLTFVTWGLLQVRQKVTILTSFTQTSNTCTPIG
jgi:hypothetical protein